MDAERATRARSIPLQGGDGARSAAGEARAQTVIDSGTDWKELSVSGTAEDDSSKLYKTGEQYDTSVFSIKNSTGITNAPLETYIKDDLSTALSSNTSDTTEFLVDKKITDQIETARNQGYLTTDLKLIAEEPSTTSTTACPSVALSKSASLTLSKTLGPSKSLSGNFTGTLSLTKTISGSATGVLHLASKRYYVLGKCIPYAAVFKKARVYGSVTVDNSATLDGSISGNYAWTTQLSKPFLTSFNFFIGPVPVHIGFNMPIDVGVDVTASVSGTIKYNATHSATGSFDYSCTLNGCSGTNGLKLSSPQPAQSISGSVSGRVYPSVWAQFGVRAYLYTEGIAYAQMGVRPYLRGDLWGYSGNTCGDANADGTSESVKALTFDLDWQLYVTGQASALGYVKKWNSIWSSSRSHLKFYDALSGSGGSTALQPLLGGPASTTVNTSTSYSAKMRPCVPYGNTVNYRFNWGDTTTSSVSGSPQSSTSASHSWGSTGTKSVSLTSLTDSHGRSFNMGTPRSISVTSTPAAGAHSFSYSATNTNSAQQNTVNKSIKLVAGQKLTIGTCGVTGSSGSGDTYLRLYNSSGSQVASNDQNCGGNLSKITYTASASGTYTLKAGCYSSTSCSGTVAWTVSGSFFYSATNTNSAQQNTTNVGVPLIEGETISLGTCGVTGASGTGDTYLRFNNSGGTQVASNDDSCSSTLSYLKYTIPSGATGTHTIKAGCYSSMTCDGTVAYVITGP